MESLSSTPKFRECKCPLDVDRYSAENRDRVGIPTNIHLSTRDESSFIVTVRQVLESWNCVNVAFNQVISDRQPILQAPLKRQTLLDLQAQGIATTSEMKGFIIAVGPLLAAFGNVASYAPKPP